MPGENPRSPFQTLFFFLTLEVKARKTHILQHRLSQPTYTENYSSAAALHSDVVRATEHLERLINNFAAYYIQKTIPAPRTGGITSVTDLQKLHCKSLCVDFSSSLFRFHFKDPSQDIKADFTSAPPPVERASSKGISAHVF